MVLRVQPYRPFDERDSVAGGLAESDDASKGTENCRGGSVVRELGGPKSIRASVPKAIPIAARLNSCTKRLERGMDHSLAVKTCDRSERIQLVERSVAKSGDGNAGQIRRVVTCLYPVKVHRPALKPGLPQAAADWFVQLQPSVNSPRFAACRGSFEGSKTNR